MIRVALAVLALVCGLPARAFASSSAAVVATVAGLQLLQSSCGKHDCKTWLQSATKPELRVPIDALGSPIGRLFPMRSGKDSRVTPGAVVAGRFSWQARGTDGKRLDRDSDGAWSELSLETVQLDPTTTGVLVTTTQGYETLHFEWRLVVPSDAALNVVVRDQAGWHGMTYDFGWGFVAAGKSVGYYFFRYESFFSDQEPPSASDGATRCTRRRWNAAEQRFVPASDDPIPMWGLIVVSAPDADAFRAERKRIEGLFANRGANATSRTERVCEDARGRLSITRSEGLRRLAPGLILYAKLSMDRAALESVRRALRACAPSLKLNVTRVL
jgi:hypothetical protein